MSGQKAVARKFTELPEGITFRLGTVTAYNPGPPRTVNATIGGVAVNNITLLDSAAGTFGSNVWVVSAGKGKLLAIGHSTGAGATSAMTSGRLVLTDTTALVNLTQQDTALMLGAANNSNMIFDRNSIQARNNGASSQLFLNELGGTVSTGGVLVAAGGLYPNGVSGPVIASNGSYLNLASPSDVYYDGNNHFFRTVSAGANLGYFNNTELGIHGTRALLFATYGGGWFMQDTSWIRAAGNKGIYTAGIIRCDGSSGNAFQFSGTGYMFNHITDTDTGIYYDGDGSFRLLANGVTTCWIEPGVLTVGGAYGSRIRLYSTADDNHHLRYSSDSAATVDPSSGEAANGAWLQGYANVVLRTVSASGAGGGAKSLMFNGNCNIPAAGSYAKFSTIEAKDEIVPINAEESLEQVLQWKPVKYHIKGEADSLRCEGFIAEELYKTSPQVVVVTSPDAERPNWPNSIDYGHLTVRLTSAVQALSAKVEQLTKRIEELENANGS